MKKDSTKPKKAKPYRIPTQLWRFLKKHLPKPPTIKKPGRPRVNNRNVIDGIWHVLWTGCQWKAIERDWFGVSSSVLHERFQTWQKEGLFDKLFKKMVRHYAREQRIGWKWQSVDSMMSPAVKRGIRSPQNRGRNVHFLSDEMSGAIL